jgi:hypothetical protein
MNRKKYRPVFISLSLLLVLVAVWLVLLYQPWTRDKKTDTYFGEGISGFCINEICIQKDNEIWMISDGKIYAPANKETIENYISKFKSLKLEAITSINKDKFGDLSIGIEPVILKINNKQLEIGGVNSNYDGTYVKPENDDKVYDLPEVFIKNNLVDTNLWLNKSITNLPVLQIKKVSVMYKNKIREVLPNNGQWGNIKWIEKVANLVAVKFLQSSGQKYEVIYDFALETDTGITHFKLGQYSPDKNNTVYWATNSEKFYYEISKDDFTLLTGNFN